MRNIGKNLNELQQPRLEAKLQHANCAFFHKVHTGTVDFDRLNYLIPVPGLRQTRKYCMIYNIQDMICC